MNLSSVFVNAYMAGLIDRENQDVRPEDVQIHGDLASLMQFAELTIQSYQISEMDLAMIEFEKKNDASST